MNMHQTGSREAWVDFAKGICIIAVVCLYAQGQMRALAPPVGWLDHWVAFAKPFRMPDFFLLSGLFLARVIDRPWRSYLDTKVVHYLYFLLLWILIFSPVAWQESPWSLSASGLIKFFAYQLLWPHAMLWFILVLPMYFLLTRLTRAVPQWAMLGIAIAMHLFVSKTGLHLVDAFCERYVFFFAGYMFANQFFALAQWVRGHAALAACGLIAWAVLNGYFVLRGWANVPGFTIALGFAGAMAVLTIGSLLSQFASMRWLSYVGRHSIVVYLGFYLPMLAWVWLGGRIGAATSAPNLMGLAVVVLSIVSAFALYWAVRGNWARFLFERPAWARLPQLTAAPVALKS